LKVTPQITQTAIKTATKEFWPLAEERPNLGKSFIFYGAGRGGSNPHDLAIGGF
jgi:hypothetical protein